MRPAGRWRLAAAAFGAALVSTGFAAAAESSGNGRIGAPAALSPVTISVNDSGFGFGAERAPSSTDIGMTLYQDNASGRRLAFAGTVAFGNDPVLALSGGGNDYAGGIELTQPVGRFSLIAGAGYSMLGAVPGFDSVGAAYGSVGGAWNLTETLSIGATFDTSQGLTTLGPERELSLYFNSTLRGDWQLSGYLIRGFAEASDDWGVGIGLSIPLRW